MLSKCRRSYWPLTELTEFTNLVRHLLTHWPLQRAEHQTGAEQPKLRPQQNIPHTTKNGQQHRYRMSRT